MGVELRKMSKEIQVKARSIVTVRTLPLHTAAALRGPCCATFEWRRGLMPLVLPLDREVRKRAAQGADRGARAACPKEEEEEEDQEEEDRG